MTILEASILFVKAHDIRAQLDYISGHEKISGDDRLFFNNLIRVIDKIYMSSNTREHRLDLENFILFNGDAIYRKYTELSNISLPKDSYSIKIDL